MHICLPDTRKVCPAHGSAFLLYNVHIDGLYHCSLRFKQLLHLNQALAKHFAPPYYQLPPFPPKKFLPLSASQVEERRSQLEKYLQNISQDKAICNSPIFNSFLLEAQRESTRIQESHSYLDIELVNGQKIRLQIETHDSTDAVLAAVCRALGLADRYHAYFCLCLCGYDVIRDKLIIKRRLSFFESPYITLQMAIQQQEQLQALLTSTLAGSGVSSETASCACLCTSCSAPRRIHHTNPTNGTTNVPPIGSSSGSHSSVNINNSSGSSSSSASSSSSSSSSSGCSNSTSGNIISNNLANDSNNNELNQNSISHFDPCGRHHQTCNQHACYHQQQQQPQQQSRPTYQSRSASSSFVTHRILLRKSYWDPTYDTYLLSDQQALNLLFIQTVYDIKHSLMFVNRETYYRLESLLASDSKLDYILLARTLKYYNYVHFEPCISDYPRPGTKVMISIGSKELNMRVLKAPTRQQSGSSSQPAPGVPNEAPMRPTTAVPSPPSQGSTSAPSNDEPVLYCTSSLSPHGYNHLITKDDLVEEEYNFKVPLIRCWRLTSLETLNSKRGSSAASAPAQSTRVRPRSLPLFNSVVGSERTTSINNNNNNDDGNINGYSPSMICAGSQRSVLCNGTSGASLIAALTGANGGHLASRLAQRHGSCQHENTTCCGQQRQLNSAPANRCRLATADQPFSQYELSFEYLVSKYQLKWITISSDQAIFISISLQGVVDELVSKRDSLAPLPLNSNVCESSAGPPGSLNSPMGSSLVGPINRQTVASQQDLGTFAYMNRDGTQRQVKMSGNQQPIGGFGTAPGCSPAGAYGLALARERHQHPQAQLLLQQQQQQQIQRPQPTRLISWRSSQVSEPRGSASFEISSFKKAPSPIINDAFEGVTNDDDL